MATSFQSYTWPPINATASSPSSGLIGSPIPTEANLAGAKDGSGILQPLLVDGSGNLNVNIGASSGTLNTNLSEVGGSAVALGQGAMAASFPVTLASDQSVLNTSDGANGSVTPGAVASKSELIGAQYNTSLPTLTNGQQSALQSDSSGRLLVGSIAGALPTGGNSVGTVGLNTGTNSIGTVGLNAGVNTIGSINNISGTVSLPTGASTEATLAKLTLAQASATASETGPLVQGATTTAAPTYTTGTTNPLSMTTGGAVRVDASATTQPVSGTVTANQGSANATPWNENLAQVGGSSITLGQKVSTSSLPVVMASDQSAIPTTAATPTARTITQAAVIVGTSAVRLTVSGSAPASTRVVLAATPDSASTAKFYIGSSSVTNSGATRGIQIVAGQSFIANSDAGDYYIISDTAGQTVYVVEQA